MLQQMLQMQQMMRSMKNPAPMTAAANDAVNEKSRSDDSFQQPPTVVNRSKFEEQARLNQLLLEKIERLEKQVPPK